MAIFSLDFLNADQTALKSENPRAVGIDLGTTHSLVALDIDGVITVLPDENGEVLLPSIVRYLDNCNANSCLYSNFSSMQERNCIKNPSIIVGELAKSTLISDPNNTIQSIKRQIGRDCQIATAQGNRTPVEISAEILRQLMKRVHAIDPKIHHAVITVPAYFDEAQRQATKRAAQLAGIEVLRLLNEPTAAAVAYGLDHLATGCCLVFDLGGGTFDVSLLNITQGVCEVLATGGDTALGGDDMDHLLADWIASHLSSNDVSVAEIRTKARLAKEILTDAQTASVELSNGITLNISRESFEVLITPMIERTLKICQRVLTDAGCDKSNIDSVILVGGATKIPMLQQKVAAFFNKQPQCDRDPSTVVAIGAGLQASVLSGNRQSQQLLLDVIPLSLGLEMMGGVVEKILPRNTPIPACTTETFTTYADNQTGLLLHIVQGERELAKDCRSLGRFELTGIPAMPAGQAKIEVTYQIDLDGLLVVNAKETNTDQQVTMQVKPTYGLQEKDVVEAIENAIINADTDIKEKNRVKKQQESALQERMNAILQHAITGKSIDEFEKV